MDPVNPVVLTKNVQATCYGFIETTRRNFGGMFHAARVDTGYPASSKRHPGDFSTSLFLRQKLDVFSEKGVIERLESTETGLEVQPVSMPVTKWTRKNDP
jgi:hypothetical protein